jgi:hypothetical protein
VDDATTDKIARANEVERRLRLDRFPMARAVVGPHPGLEFDVIVMLTPPDAALATRVEELCPDIRVRVGQGTWQRG